jgi:hypothetical protein
MQVTGRCASRLIRSMLAPLAAISPAMTVIAAGASGLPSRVTCSRPPRAGEFGHDEESDPAVLFGCRAS